LLLSVVTWLLIAFKALELRRAGRLSRAYVERFGKPKDIVSLNHTSEAGAGALANLTAAGLQALRQHQRYHESEKKVAGNLTDTLTRGLRQTIQDHLTRLEAGLGVLATIGNTAPFIGLFGTVIGIMSALKGISRTGSAGLDVVAGPKGEALIATAAGIACAVSAVVGCNSFVRRLKAFRNTMESFACDLFSRITTEGAAGHAYPQGQELPRTPRGKRQIPDSPT
jgi:biopolymer transport protein ExbB